MNNLDKIAKVSISQIEFGEKLGLSLEGHTVSVAAAMIQDCISNEFWGRKIVSPSEGQIDFANQLGYDENVINDAIETTFEIEVIYDNGQYILKARS